MSKKKTVARLSSEAKAGAGEPLEVWHKFNCAKSIEVMTALKKEGVKPLIFEYLVTPPTEELVRKKEPIYKEKFEGKKMTEEKWIKAMVKYPILIERPILIRGNKAIIGRPTERIFEMIDKKPG